MNTITLLTVTFVILLLSSSDAFHSQSNLTAALSFSMEMMVKTIKQLINMPPYQSNKPIGPILFDFTDPKTELDKWIEVSDTARTEGRSKATLVPQVASNYRSAIFFFLLNPQPNGACFAGVDYLLDNWDLSQYKGISIDLHRQGEVSGFKLIFYDNCSDIFTCPSYESFFETTGGRQQIELAFSTFAPYFRGFPKPDAQPLDLTKLSRFGIQAYGGVNAIRKQYGPGSIELFTVTVYKETKTPEPTN
ncbi:NADH:ubiquinone oxidoreductase complex I intermediate-associated protein 30 [Schistosoma japonicum]|nr:NADH:ubiquinone oxidoreductase complex I intermediate-associated protein 30 [Schistosoma japonicum]KAH8861599.1 NADH:ubiquinone oxidoreductase complex I intermediate-associated protein 30 [Schistosoma japonicum]KAH8861600.1 NADH:ubiquinone oxidoreductase complex I intermediate-associated protein 30 [Schistosoma japonicum]KAH8861601.1 NADH:ubiquinone oxidoreductase complex I intermediate-associated protein 30 [Schistosoma japonicum]